nr:RNA-directed DNA polymerase, eukaryota [Tanacetum cinerariifolium]
ICFINVNNTGMSSTLLSHLRGQKLGRDRFKFHANIARFHRAPLNGNKCSVRIYNGKTHGRCKITEGGHLTDFPRHLFEKSRSTVEKKDVGTNRSGTNVPSKDVGVTGICKLYVHVMKGNNMSGTMDYDSIPAIVLDDECLYSKDLSKSLLGRVKEFASLSNLKTALMNEGFVNIKIQVGSWFSVLRQASIDFTPKGRIVWVEIKDQSDDGFKNGDPIVQDVGSCGDDSDVAEVPKTLFEESTGQKEKQSEDSFGFTPNDDTNEFCMNEENVRSVNDDNPQNCNVDEVQTGKEGNSVNKDSKVDVSESVCLGHFKRSKAPRTGGSNLYLLEELVKVGQTMGYNMDGPRPKGQKDWVKELCLKNKVNFFVIQETKIESMELCSVKTCWGNFAFDYVRSDSVGNSGGILCVWDPNSFRRSNTTISDYFIMIRGVWLKTGVNLLIVAVYAPHDLRDKRMLWDYLAHVINQWDGEVVTMGDFNEVRYKSDRFALVFNVQGADVFNLFIANAGLEEVPLGGNSFTWCHKSATKMSKLDRFLISENLLITCPSISATTLDRYLYDHHTWSEGPGDDSNDMRSMMRKLKYLKVKIQEWNNGNRNNTKRAIEKYKEDLEALDAAIDKGNGSDDIVNKRMEPNTVKHEFLQHFWRRFDKPTVSRAYVNMSYPKSITINQQMDLERDVSKEELKRAVWDYGTDSPLVWMGSRLASIVIFWSTIENDVFEAVKHFFTYGDIPKGCNSSFIALITKIPDANLVKDFRPISLIGSIYKIIAKILANRLVGVLEDVVNEVQSAFIAERQILDGRSSLMSPTEEFQFFKGLKKGDPLSLFLFILIMESLHLSFQRVVDAGMFMGIKLSLSLNLSHMFYADDVVFVGQWCDGNINTLVHVLECFYRASGLQINTSKSKIMGVHVEDEKVKYAASKLGCLILNTLFSYLGTKVGGSMSRVQAWKEVVDKVKSRLSNWKMKVVSIGEQGRFKGLDQIWVAAKEMEGQDEDLVFSHTSSTTSTKADSFHV